MGRVLAGPHQLPRPLHRLMPASPDTIRIVGLAELQRELRTLDKKWPGSLRLVNKDAAELIADVTRRSFLARPGVAPKVAPSVKALAQQRSAAVKIGGQKYPFAMGSNFGSVAFKQFPNPTKPDWSLYKSISDERETVVESYGDAIERLAKRAFPH